MSVTLSEVKRAARAHRAPLAGESAGYLVLAIADQVLQAPRLVQATEVQLTEDGALRVLSGHASSDADAELSLRQALDQLLLVASSGSAALTRASRRTVPTGLSSLVRELETALIPVNRSAARRALARVHRETARALESGSLPEDEQPQIAAPPAPPVVAAPVEPPAAVALPVAPPIAVAAPVALPAVEIAAGLPLVEVAAGLPAVEVAAAPPAAVEVAVALPAAVEVAVALPAAVEVAVAQPAAVEVAVALPAGVEVAVALPAAVAPTVPLAALVEPAAAPPLAAAWAELRESNPAAELTLDLDQDSETPALVLPVRAMPVLSESHLDSVVSALCEQLPAPPQFMESDALTAALAVRTVLAPPVSPAPEEPELLLDIDVEFETDAVDSSAAPTVMRAVAVQPVSLSAQETSEPLPFDLPLEARTRPEPVVLRKALRPLLDLLPLPPVESEPLTPTPTPTPRLGTLATELPILAREQIAEMTLAATLAAELAQFSLHSADHTERMPEVLPTSSGMATVALVESKKSDVHELLNSFQVAEPDVNHGLRRAIKEMAELDLTPAPFAALIR